MTDVERGELPVCVVGAGSSGIAASQVLYARGIPSTTFELGSEIGGNWRYRNDNGISAAYASLHINTSRRLMAYATYPMPEHLPHYPSHSDIVDYFDAYVDHFGFRDAIRFRTRVTAVAPDGDGAWAVTWEPREGGEPVTDRFRAVLVANGHHWDPRWPEPAFPGADAFTGTQEHSHGYETPEPYRDKRVLVLGIGNSACDIAVETSRVAERTFLAMRRGAYIVPKFVFGKPTDETATAAVSRLPLAVQRTLSTAMLRLAQGDVTRYGMPRPDHKLLSAHPTVSSDLLPRVGHGDVAIRPNLERFDGDEVVFADGTRERIDAVIYCTGYRISFPFLDPALLAAPDNRVSLFRRVVPPDHPGLFFVGLVQPLGAVMPIAEAQSEWIADVLEGTVALPSPAAMRREAAREDRATARRYVASKRHTIQVDFHPYLRSLRRERRRRAGTAT